MLKRNLISFAALSGFVVLAFGSTPDVMEQIQEAVEDGGGTSSSGGGGGSDSLSACREYWEHYNSLSCIPAAAKQDVDTNCPAELNNGYIDMSGYYRCMKENTTCDGNIPAINTASCQM